MNKVKIVGAWVLLLICADANAQSVSSRATGTVGGLTGSVSVGAGTASGGPAGATSGVTDFSGLNSTPGGSVGPGGDWNGGTNARLGGRDVTIRGAVASEGGANAFKAGAGLKF